MSDPKIVMINVTAAGAMGGRSKSNRKRETAVVNAAKAREAKLLYRLDPSLRPHKKQKEIGNGK